ncbi:diacylglycerol/lipid kinase family protein [Microbacterium flavum]|uniref:diacylglycerol/lipid kinase family protein n=1 Tax=Microbacterium flavum TaxID=415216 RepID=UPI001FEA02D0|nr:diacylglycerol kinase family protein [Microbacterium flavum]
MTRRLAIVWNPSKTDQGALTEGLHAALIDAPAPEVSWWETSEDDPGGDATGRAVAWNPDLVVVAGGDGTVRVVAEHLAAINSSVELGIVPLGTGNLLARNLDIPLNDISAAFTRVLTGQARPVDIGWVDLDLAAGHERYGFVVMVGFGIDANMIAETNDDLKDKAGWLAYVESLGRALSATDIVPFHITADDQPARDEEATPC